MNQEEKLNYQFEVQDHIHVQIQFQKIDNLSKYQCDPQKFDVSQVQLNVLKLNLGFQNNMSPRSNQ